MNRYPTKPQLGLIAWIFLSVIVTPVSAITLGQTDDFQDGTTMGWGGSRTLNVADVGPHGSGDHALEVISDDRFVVRNGSARSPNDGVISQWKGDWLTAGVTQITMDVLNPNDFDLVLRLGIAGPGGAGVGGSDDAYITGDSHTIPSDNTWHSIAFDVQVGDFSRTGSVNDIDSALHDVRQFRIIHNPLPLFVGARVSGTMRLDNIRAVPEPGSLQCASVLLFAILVVCPRIRLPREATWN